MPKNKQAEFIRFNTIKEYINDIREFFLAQNSCDIVEFNRKTALSEYL